MIKTAFYVPASRLRVFSTYPSSLWDGQSSFVSSQTSEHAEWRRHRHDHKANL